MSWNVKQCVEAQSVTGRGYDVLSEQACSGGVRRKGQRSIASHQARRWQIDVELHLNRRQFDVGSFDGTNIKRAACAESFVSKLFKDDASHASRIRCISTVHQKGFDVGHLVRVFALNQEVGDIVRCNRDAMFEA